MLLLINKCTSDPTLFLKDSIFQKGFLRFYLVMGKKNSEKKINHKVILRKQKNLVT